MTNEGWRERQEKRAAAPKDPNDPRHGTLSFYVNHGCRCDKCSGANRRYKSRDWAFRSVKINKRKRNG